MTSTFITATGTGIGKTLVTSLLTRQLRAKGKTVRALKPVISGFTDETLAESDTAELLRAMDRPVTPETITDISPPSPQPSGNGAASFRWTTLASPTEGSVCSAS